MKNTEISIVVPVYNGEKFLQKCLDSLISQSLNNIEIICVNDGSTDDSLKIMREYAKKDKRIKVINQKNQGQSIARNNAMKVASGEYLAFVDADDYVNDCFLESLYSAAVAENADIAVGNIIRVEENKKNYKVLFYEKKRVASDTDDVFKLLNIPKACYVWNRIYRREFIINNTLFFKEKVAFEDIIWSTLVAFKAKKAVSVPKADYYYIYNESSIVNTTENNPEKLKDRHDAFDFYNRFVIKYKINSPLQWKKISKVYFLGLPLFKVKEIPDVMKKYYFCKLPIVSVKIKSNF